MAEHDHHHHHPDPHHDAPAAARVWSLLCASGLERLAGAAVLIAALWAAVFWALR